jgi:hypothetical protein
MTVDKEITLETPRLIRVDASAHLDCVAVVLARYNGR